MAVYNVYTLLRSIRTRINTAD